MLFTVNLQSCRQAQRDIRAKEIEYTARAKIELVGNASNVCFQAVNYGKIPIEKGGLFLRFMEVKGTSVEIVANSYSDFGRTHPDDPQLVIIQNPLKPAPVSGPPEPPFGFALAIFRGEQTFMETKPFTTETFVWFFEKRVKWTKEAESLGNVSKSEKAALKKAIDDFSNEVQVNLQRRVP